MIKKVFPIICAAVCVCMLCACGSKAPVNSEPTPVPTVAFAAGEFPIDSQSLTLSLKAGESSLLDSFTALKSADLCGSESLDEVFAWAQAHPDVSVTYTVTLPDGSTVKSDLRSVDLSHVSDGEIDQWVSALGYLPKVDYIILGSERNGLSWEGIYKLCQVCPEADIDYGFTLYGQQHYLGDTRIDLNHTPVEDNGAEVVDAMRCMKDLLYLDMDSCGVPNQEMAAIRDEFPDVKVVWRIWFGENYSVRTDVERILASMPSRGGMLEPGNYESLMYCTDVKYLDVGHNDLMSDIEFVKYMPKLEVAILAMACWSDAGPLAYCPELEYLEIQTTNISDLSPLSGLTKLRHLNIAYCRDINDISPLYDLELERLWIGCIDPVPSEQVDEMQRCHPDCLINVDVYEDPVGGAWRYVDYNELAYVYIYHDRYIMLREQFGDYDSKAYSFIWNDPLY